MTRILVIEPAGNKWGSERALLDLLDGMRQADLAMCLPPRRPLEGELLRRGIRLFPSYVYALHEKTKLHRAWAALGVLRACLTYRPDVIYLNQSGAYKIAMVAARLLNIPMVAHIRIYEDVAYIARQRPDPRLLRGVIAISSDIELEVSRFRELEGIPCHKILDAYALHGRFRPTVNRRRIDGRIACVGRIAPIKGQEVLVEALPQIAPSDTPIECVIAGNDDSPFAEQLKARTSRGTGIVACRWLGVVEDAVDLMRTCVAMVAPSHKEALGRVVFEAWEAGAVPVVFAGSGGAAEIVTASGGGLLYEEQSGTSLARALERAVSLPAEERAALVEKGRAWLVRNCDPSAYAAQVLAIFAAAARR